MLEKPDLNDDEIIVCLQVDYGLGVDQISFLPLGADLNTAVFSAQETRGKSFFVKLRRGVFNPASITVPNYLSNTGILKQVIPAEPTTNGRLWAALGEYKVILYPFIEGQHAYAQKLSTSQWAEFGAALNAFHQARYPVELTNDLPRDTFSPHWRNSLREFLDRIEQAECRNPLAEEMAAFLQTKSSVLQRLCQRTEDLARALRRQANDFILCHGDIHGWNLLVAPSGELFIVDWDTLIFAPKERDLMFIGGGLGESGYTPQEEETMFYRGYGQTNINPSALAYYRGERVIEDIAVYCEQIFLSGEGGEDRFQALENIKSNFSPNGTIEMVWHNYNHEHE